MHTVNKTLDKTITLDINASYIINDIQKDIESKQGIPTKQQMLMYKGKILIPNTSINQYSINQIVLFICH